MATVLPSTRLESAGKEFMEELKPFTKTVPLMVPSISYRHLPGTGSTATKNTSLPKVVNLSVIGEAVFVLMSLSTSTGCACSVFTADSSIENINAASDYKPILPDFKFEKLGFLMLFFLSNN